MEQLKEMSVADVVASAMFKEKLQTVIDNVCASRLKMANAARKRDRVLKRHPIDSMIERDFFTADNLAPEFIRILEKQSKLTSAERANVYSICMEAGRLTVAEMRKNVKKETK